MKTSKAKMKPISLNDEDDAVLVAIGGGSRTAAVKELMEIHRILSKLKLKDPNELKYKVASMVESFSK